MIENEHDETFKFRLPGTLLSRLYAEKRRSGVSVAETLRRAADTYLATREAGAQALEDAEEEKSRATLLVEKWRARNILPTDTADPRYPAIAVLLENQERHFKRVQGESTCDALTDIVGENYEQIVLHAIRYALEGSDIFEMCSVQPMTGPIGQVMYLVPRLTNGHTVTENLDGIPEVNFNIEAVEVRAESRRTRGRITREDIAQSTIEEAVSAAVVEAAQDSFRRLLQRGMAQAGQGSAADNDPHEAIHAGMQIIHKATQRGMANVLVCHQVQRRLRFPKAIADNLRVIYDPLFPRDKLLLMRYGSLLDTAAVWAPYEFTFQPYSEDEIVVGVRDSIKIVNPESFYLISLT